MRMLSGVCLMKSVLARRRVANVLGLNGRRSAPRWRWLSVHRGLSARSVSRHCRMLKPLLHALGNNAQTCSAARIRAVFRAKSQRCSPSHIGTMTSALRGYLHFLAASGLCRPGLDQAVPPVLQWRLAAMPRYLPTADVERLIATCDRTNPLDARSGGIAAPCTAWPSHDRIPFGCAGGLRRDR
jgi:site-specific recombinase XerC